MRLSEPCGPGFEGSIALEAVAFFFVADLSAEVLFEWEQEVEGDVGGLEFFVVGVGDVVGEGAVGGDAGGWFRGAALREGCGVAAGQKAGGDGLGVAFYAGELAGYEDVGVGAELEGFGEERGGVDVGVAVDLAEAEEGGLLEAGDEAEDAGLLAEFEVVLKADEVVGVGAEVFLAELDDGVGPAAGLGVGEAGGLHGAEAEGVSASAGGLFDGEAAFEVLELCGGLLGGCGLCRSHP